MARALRIEYPGAWYHVLNRGVERRRIFADNKDCEKFLEIIRVLYPRFQVAIHCYCLMPNHFHMFVQTPLGKLRSFMQDLCGDYAHHYNVRHHRIGPLFQGRYRAMLVDTEAYALEISRYIHRNPVRASLAEEPEGYRWSSYAAYLGIRRPDTYLHTAFLLSRFEGDINRKRKLFRQFTMDSAGDEYNPFMTAQGGVVEGGEKFSKWVKKEKVPRERDSEISRLAELQKPAKAVLEAMQERVSLLTKDTRLGRKLVLYGLRHSTTLTLGEICSLTGAKSPIAVSQTVRRLNMVRRADSRLDGTMKQLESQCRHIVKM